MKRRSLLLSECTLAEVEDHLRRSPKVIVPVGSTEQHGPHAPFGTDALLATEVSVRVARHVDALVAPVLAYGLSGDHRGFAGVPYLSVATFTGLMQDVTWSLADGGFREIVFVNGHYTNVIAMAAALAEIAERLPAGTVAFPFNYWDALPEEQLQAYLGPEVGLHANIGETSAVLAVDEGLVDMERAVAEFPDLPAPFTPAKVSAFFLSGRGTTYRATRSGVWGDPRGSTAERGRAYLDQIETACVRFIHEVEQAFETFPPRPAAAAALHGDEAATHPPAGEGRP
jgi:creatinine amidohydrolase